LNHPGREIAARNLGAEGARRQKRSPGKASYWVPRPEEDGRPKGEWKKKKTGKKTRGVHHPS